MIKLQLPGWSVLRGEGSANRVPRGWVSDDGMLDIARVLGVAKNLRQWLADYPEGARKG